MMQPIKFKSIKNRLTFWFLIVALLPLTIVGVLNYIQRVSAIEKRAFDTLAAIRDLKISELGKWLGKKSNDIHALAQDPEIRAMADFMHAGDRPESHPELLRSVRESMQRFIANYSDANEILIIDAATGAIAIATDKGLEGADRSDNPYFMGPMETGRDFIKDIFFSQALGKMSMTFSTPIFESPARGNRIAAVLVLRVFLENTVYSLLLDRSGLGETGETLIVNDKRLALNPLRHSSLPPLQVKIDSPPARLAMEKKTGILETVDYRGEKVLTAYGYLPETGWGFIAKQDLREINAPINATLFNFVLMFFLSFMAVYGVSSLLSKAISRPVAEMTEVSRRIQSGDMAARNTAFPYDEFGFLAQSFNRMADSLMYQMEMQKAGVQITESMLSAFNLREFSMALQQKLIELTDSHSSAFYIRRADRSRFDLYSSIGMNQDSVVSSFNADQLEGEFGHILTRKVVVHQTRIPENTAFTFKTVTGAFIPRAILAIPLRIAEEVMGVIVLTSLSDYSSKALELMNRSWMMAMNASFANFTANEETRILAARLNSTNNELRAKATELASKTEILEQQSIELREKNRELDSRRIQVEEANRLKSQFLSNMSHELRTPLNSVMALSRVLVLQAGGKLNAEEKNYLEIISRNGRSLLDLINDILDLSKIESGRMDLKIKSFSPRSVIEMILERLGPIAGEKGIALTSEFAEDLPAIESDESRVHHILQNIIGNAVKFTEEGGVAVNAFADENTLFIEVADTGIGIPEKDLPHVFEEFRQVDGTSTRRYEGTGLGLTIARKSAEMLGGRISVVSEVGRGSVFTLGLPRQWQRQRGDAAREIVAPPKTDRPATKGTVMVVDDDPETIRLLTGFLYSEGFEVVTALSGEAALQTACRRRPDAITLDLFMPDMDGLEVLQGLKREPVTRDIPVIIVSVSDDHSTGFALGAMGYVTKPVSREKLAGELAKLQHWRTADAGMTNILIVDDNEVDRMELARIAKELGLIVRTAENGAQCLEMIERQTPDILLLDLIMPKMDGFKVLDRMKAMPAWRHIQVIVVTAKDLSPEEARQLNGQTVAVIEKSVMASKELLVELKTILQGLNPGKPHPTPQPLLGALSSDGPPRILVIEDNPDNMITIRAILGREYCLLEAFTGDEGLALARAKAPELILLDMALPGMDGMSVIREIRAHAPSKDIPVIAMTAQAMSGDREKMIDAGCNDYIAKPFHPEELLAKTAAWLKPREE